MAYEERYRPADMAHNIIMEGRKKLSVSGVQDVESFDENLIVTNTCQGTLLIRGEGLHLEKLSLDSGEILVQGAIECLEYENDTPKASGFFARLFK